MRDHIMSAGLACALAALACFFLVAFSVSMGDTDIYLFAWAPMVFAGLLVWLVRRDAPEVDAGRLTYESALLTLLFLLIIVPTPERSTRLLVLLPIASVLMYVLACLMTPPNGRWRRPVSCEGIREGEVACVPQGRADSSSGPAEAWGLTPREKDVLGWLARGYTLSTIAHELAISSGTVDTHVRHIYQKAGVTRRDELLRAAEEIRRN